MIIIIIIKFAYENKPHKCKGEDNYNLYCYGNIII